MAKKEIYNDIITIKMDVNQLPTYKIDTAGEFIKWGKDNNFPKELLNSYNNHPEHAAIVKGKSRYLSGLKIVPSQDLPQVQQFLAKANRFDSWYELRKKCDSDKAIYGGFACQVTTNLIGQPIEFYHLDMGKIRLSADNCGVWYSEDWTAKSYHLKKTYFPFYKDGFIGASIYYSKDFTPSLNELDGLYPSPDYSSVLLDINTDIEISNFFHSLVKNGFSAGHIITFFSGKLTPEVKEDIKERFQEKHQGTQNAGKVVLSFTNPDGKGAEVVNVTPTGLADQYEALNKRNQQKIITGHNVPGVLFKIKTEGTLGDRNELDLAHELFINEYAKVEQVAFNEFIDKMFKRKTGLDVTFEVEQVQAIGLNWLDPNVNKYLTNDEAREKLGLAPIDKTVSGGAQAVIDSINSLSPLVANKVLESMSSDEIRALVGLVSTTAPKVDANGAPVVIQETIINEALKNLSGRQRQGLDSIVRKFNKGDYNQEQALIHIKSFGFSDEDSLKYLGIVQDEIEKENKIKVQQSNDKEKRFIEWATSRAIQIDDEDEIIDIEYVNFKDSKQVLKFELSKQKLYTANRFQLSETDLRNGILNQLKGNPYAKPEELAKALNVDKDKVTTVLEWLAAKKLIDTIGGLFTPTEKGLDKDTEDYETEIYTVYKYDKRPDVSGSKLISTSREFCRKMVGLTSGTELVDGKMKAKRLTYNEIENYTNEFGEDAWDFRGGFYNDGTETTPWCRHIWVGETRIKRKKK